MSSNALFSNTSRNSNKNLVELKAGKMIVKGNMIHPDERKGQLYVYQSDDSLMHFCWKDRSTGVIEDDLIIFPDDCEFKHVTQCKTGRVYLLRFKSSNRKFFFWLQDMKTEKDTEYCKKINELLNHPPVQGSQRNNGNSEGDLQNLLNNMSQQQLMQLFGGVGQIGGFGSLLGSMNRPFSNARNNSSTNAVASTPSRSNISSERAENPESPKSISVNDTPNSDSEKYPRLSADDQIQLSNLQNLLTEIPTSEDARRLPQHSLQDFVEELSRVISSVLSKVDNLDHSMEPFLPTGDNLYTTLSTPQFLQAFTMFWTTLQTGQIGDILRQFEITDNVITAANSGQIHGFIKALEESHREVIYSDVLKDDKISDDPRNNDNSSAVQRMRENSEETKEDNDDMNLD